MRYDDLQKSSVQMPVEQERSPHGHQPVNANDGMFTAQLKHPTTDSAGKRNVVKRGPKKRGRYHGVSYRRDQKKWVARITVGSTEKYLGFHDDAIIAAKVYDSWARRLHGAKATLNFQ